MIATVFAASKAQHGERLVMIALADAAHDDGVSWELEETIAAKTLLGVSTVRAAIKKLEAAGELEVRQAQRGQRRINVYRVTVGRPHAVDYDRLPFELGEPFSDDRQNLAAVPPPVATADDRQNPAVDNPDDRQNSALRPPEYVGAYKEDPSGTLALAIASAREESVDNLYSALVKACFPDHAVLTAREKRQVALAARNIAGAGALPADVPLVAAAYAKHPSYSKCVMTAQALSSHWAELLPAKGAAKPLPERCVECELGGGQHLEGCSKAAPPAVDPLAELFRAAHAGEAA